jgi:hypothetical protein
MADRNVRLTQCNCGHRGYVLIMTLLLLVVAAVALAAVTAESHRRAMAARNAQDELQRRWAAISCEQSLLSRTPAVLKKASDKAGKPVGRYTQTMTLGGTKLTLVFADEQAKANLNVLANQLEATKLRETLHTLTGPGVAIDLMPTITRDKDKAGKVTVTQHYGSYGQVLGEVSPADLFDGLADRFTCWGDTKLNTKAASNAAVVAVAATVLSDDELHRFERAVKKTSAARWRDAFREINILPDKVKLMDDRVTEASTCSSLWVMPEGGRRCRFAVNGTNGTDVFEW